MKNITKNLRTGDVLEITFQVKVYPSPTCDRCEMKDFLGFCGTKCHRADHDYLAFGKVGSVQVVKLEDKNG